MCHKALLWISLAVLVVVVAPMGGSEAWAETDGPSAWLSRSPDAEQGQVGAQGVGGFYTVTVDDAPGAGSHNSIAVDSNGIPHIGYINAETGALMYAYQAGERMTSIVLDDSDTFGYGTSIAIDANNYPHIIYVSNQHIHYAYQTASGWQFEQFLNNYNL